MSRWHVRFSAIDRVTGKIGPCTNVPTAGLARSLRSALRRLGRFRGWLPARLVLRLGALPGDPVEARIDQLLHRVRDLAELVAAGLRPILREVSLVHHSLERDRIA